MEWPAHLLLVRGGGVSIWFCIILSQRFVFCRFICEWVIQTDNIFHQTKITNHIMIVNALRIRVISILITIVLSNLYCCCLITKLIN